MNWIKFTIAISLVGALWSCEPSEKNIEDQKTEVDSEHLINVDQLLKLYNDTNYVVLDFRKVEDYNKGHIPGAVQIYRNEITVKVDEIKGLVDTKENIELILSAKGVSNDKKIIVYDGIGACESARFWWTMHHYGFLNVLLLNGDFDIWKDKGLPIEIDEVKRGVTEFRFPQNYKDELYASKKDVIKALNDPDVLLLDTRTADEYNGDELKNGAFKAGRIPHSVHIDWALSIYYNGDKKFKSIEELRKIFENQGVTKGKEVIVYCHTGTRSSHSVFVLKELLGYEKVKNYDGSWVEWSHDEQLEIEI